MKLLLYTQHLTWKMRNTEKHKMGPALKELKHSEGNEAPAEMNRKGLRWKVVPGGGKHGLAGAGADVFHQRARASSLV